MPDITQGADQSALVEISNAIEPGFITVSQHTGQYVLMSPGDPKVEDLDRVDREARARFSEMLGILRASKHGRGELKSEVGRTLVRDEHENQIIRVGTANQYASVPHEMAMFASRAATGFRVSSKFREAAGVFGKENRDAADFYVVFELACLELGGPSGVAEQLGFSGRRLREFKKSANHLPATEGGRHAGGDPSKATMDLDAMSRFTTDLLAAWINSYETSSVAPRAATPPVPDALHPLADDGSDPSQIMKRGEP